MSRRSAKRNGFTLIEIMVALTIFALMSGVAYRGLDAVLAAHARVSREAAKWRDLALAFTSVRQSISAVAARSIRDRTGSIKASFSGSGATRAGDEAALELTRMGAADRSGDLADLQRIGYRVADGRFEQLGWPVLDQAPDTRPAAFTLASGVSAMTLRFLSRTGAWTASWPVPGSDAPFPAAVEMTLVLDGGGRVRRLFDLP